MANRYPLILDTTDGNKIKELPAGDNLYLRNNNIEDVQDINALGTINAAVIRVAGEKLVAQQFTDLTDVPSSYAGSEGSFVKVKTDGTGLEFASLSDLGDIGINNLNATGSITVEGSIYPTVTSSYDIGSGYDGDGRKWRSIYAENFLGSLRGHDGTLVFDADNNEIPYAVLVGAPTSLSEFDNDLGFLNSEGINAAISAAVSELTVDGDITGSVFGDDSTLLVDGVNSSINLDGTIKGDIVPDEDEVYDIGSITKKFKDLYLSGSSIYLGDAVISASGAAIDLPAGSTIDGVSIGSGSGSVDLTAFSIITGTASSNGSLSYDNTTGEFTFIPPDLTNLGAVTAESITADSLEFTGVGVVTLESGSNLVLNAANGAGNIVASGSRITGVADPLNSQDVATKSYVDAAIITGGQDFLQGDVQGSVFADDSTTLVDAVAASINLDGTVKGDIIPDANEVYDIGSPTNRFRDLYLSGSTLYIGNAQLSVTGDSIALPYLNYIAAETDTAFTVQTSYSETSGGVATEVATNGNMVGNNYFTAYLENFPTIGNVQVGWTATGLGLDAVEVINVVDNGTFVEIQIDSGDGVFVHNEEYTFTEPTIVSVISKIWGYGTDGHLTVPGNIYGSDNDRLWLGGSDNEATPWISIPNETAGTSSPVFIANNQGGGLELSAYGTTNDYVSSITLGDDFSVDTNNSSMILEGTGAWRIGSNNFGHNVEAIDPENDPGIGITVNNDLWIFNTKLSKVSSGDLILSVDSGDSTVYDWNLGTDGVTNIPGALTFPDGTTQTTAYTTNPGSPLWAVINVSGEVSFSEDAVTWTAGQKVEINGTPIDGGSVRITVGPENIVYIIQQGPTTDLYYGAGMSYALTLASYTIPSEADPEIEGYFDFRDIEYGGGYYIAVGDFTSLDPGGDIVIPVMYYSTDGANWTQGAVDAAYVSEVGGNLRGVDYDGTGWLILGLPGAFYITSPTEQLAEGNFTSIVPGGVGSPDKVTYTGDRWVMRDGDIVYFAPTAGPLTDFWTDFDTTELLITEFGMGRDEETGDILGGLSEIAGGEINGEYWFMTATQDGQILATNDGGSNWVASVPQPHTGTVLTVASDSTSTIITVDWNQDQLEHGQRIAITGATGATQLNASFYVESTPDGANTWILWQNSDFTGAVDSSLWAGSYDNGSATITYYSGTYFDGLGYGGGKFIAANDDEQLFSSTDAETWTKVNDQSNAFEYWDDVDYYATFGSSIATPSNKLVSGGAQVSLASTGTLTLPGALILPTAYPVAGLIGDATALALTKQVQILDSSNDFLYSLADGVEGQIMYFVPATESAFRAITVSVANARTTTGVDNVPEINNINWLPFWEPAIYDGAPDATLRSQTSTIAMAIFTDGAWNLQGGWWD